MRIIQPVGIIFLFLYINTLCFSSTTELAEPAHSKNYGKQSLSSIKIKKSSDEDTVSVSPTFSVHSEELSSDEDSGEIISTSSKYNADDIIHDIQTISASFYQKNRLFVGGLPFAAIQNHDPIMIGKFKEALKTTTIPDLNKTPLWSCQTVYYEKSKTLRVQESDPK